MSGTYIKPTTRQVYEGILRILGRVDPETQQPVASNDTVRFMDCVANRVLCMFKLTEDTLDWDDVSRKIREFKPFPTFAIEELFVPLDESTYTGWLHVKWTTGVYLPSGARTKPVDFPPIRKNSRRWQWGKFGQRIRKLVTGYGEAKLYESLRGGVVITPHMEIEDDDSSEENDGEEYEAEKKKRREEEEGLGERGGGDDEEEYVSDFVRRIKSYKADKKERHTRECMSLIDQMDVSSKLNCPPLDVPKVKDVLRKLAVVMGGDTPQDLEFEIERFDDGHYHFRICKIPYFNERMTDRIREACKDPHILLHPARKGFAVTVAQL